MDATNELVFTLGTVIVFANTIVDPTNELTSTTGTVSLSDTMDEIVIELIDAEFTVIVEAANELVFTLGTDIELLTSIDDAIMELV